MTAVRPHIRNPAAPDRAPSLDPHWTPARLEELAHACRTLEDDLHIELAGDPDFARRVQETW